MKRNALYSIRMKDRLQMLFIRESGEYVQEREDEGIVSILAYAYQLFPNEI